MNLYFAVAGCLALVVGIVHSILGEMLIFRQMRKGTLVPTDGSPVLKERQVRILWASWHLVTVFGWGFGAILLWLAFPSTQYTVQAFVENAILFSMLAASLIVLVGTKGRHPGWLGLLGIAISLWVGR